MEAARPRYPGGGRTGTGTVSRSRLDPELIRAYRETDYFIEGDSPLLLRVDVRSPELAEWLLRLQADSCSFLTACNPESRLLEPAENEVRQQDLARRIGQFGLPFLCGSGRHPDGEWPAEPGYAVLGMTLHAAMKLGRFYRQNAILRTDSSATPRLILLR